MTISKTMQDAINDQINRELYSEYLYLAMAAYAYGENLEGFGHWFTVQAKEEHSHAMKFFKYIYERRGKVTLKAIEKPEADFKSMEDAFEKTLKHEEFVTKNIHNLMDIAIKESDHASVSFLKWYVDEQVEEESTADQILQKLKLLKSNVNGLVWLDKELGKRGGE